ncbi:carbamoyl-phosphate synthase small subunit [Natranaerovirga pectinivora]|uniref:Carbamoyl phosphate synthase small chain n=1 Tax=Natranaerovirga pectinivora TaxID=682400 RepID=A0A4R3MMS9_9FIRM|nr:glutamine-hydrolyzing carbamoyl-phosphate synthase small subunit [Natranaerovirga pectinivora]TCT14347.1 carbamoyl-phosphate synthase small subunit [Natranaerovirga pectinivora]
MKAKLILENGEVFEGKAFGHLKETIGEVVFNTSMTGYQEVLTDPSYYGQIVTMTYPLIGNYGINLDDLESDSIKVKGFIVREKCDMPNNWRCEFELENYLKEHKVMGMEGIDTRALTKIIRNQGTMKGIITVRDLTPSQIESKFKAFHNTQAVESVTTKEIIKHEGEGLHIGIMDFGIKNDIIKAFKDKGCKLTVFPAFTKADELLNSDLDAVFLSNGPGDPKDIESVREEIKKLIGQIPITGICLGHQLLALALEGDTEKLKFGHRGGNHPVKNLLTNHIMITSQNHGYVVRSESLPEDVEVTHINLNDGSVEGLRHKKYPIYSVQFHPEAGPGPTDTAPIFDEFIDVIKK